MTMCVILYAQAYGEETTTTKRTVTESQFQYRPVELHNIPLPTTGGQVTGKIIIKKLTINNKQTCSLNLIVFAEMLGEVKMPSGKIDKPVIQDNRDGTVSIHYEPREEGLHELNIKYNSEHVQGTQAAHAILSFSKGQSLSIVN